MLTFAGSCSPTHLSCLCAEIPSTRPGVLFPRAAPAGVSAQPESKGSGQELPFGAPALH